MQQQAHYFLALPLSPTMKGLLSNWREILEPKLQFKTWVHREDYHITLAFLGHASFSQLNELKSGIINVTKQHQIFELTLAGLGTFGKQDSPRIFWAGVLNSEPLRSLQFDISNVVKNHGFQIDTRPFNPHITMARKWNEDKIFDFENIDKMVMPKEEVSSFIVENVVLYRTHLQRVPKYQPLTVFPLMEDGKE